MQLSAGRERSTLGARHAASGGNRPVAVEAGALPLEHLKVKGYCVGRMLALGERLVVGGQFFHEVAHAFGSALVLRRPGRGLKEAQQAFLVLLMVFTCDISFTKVLGVP